MIPLANDPAGLLCRKPKQSVLVGRRVKSIVVCVAWVYPVTILADWGLLHFAGDRLWFGELVQRGVPIWLDIASDQDERSTCGRGAL